MHPPASVIGNGRNSRTVLIHGAFGSPRFWSGLLPRSLRDGRVIAYPLPAHGDWQPSDTALDRLLRPNAVADAYANALQRDFGAEPVNVVGHSTGALVAMLLASRHPSRVSRLALVGGFADGTFAGQQTWVREQVLNAPLGASMLGLAVKAWTANAYTFRAGMKEMVSDWRATENCPDFAAICERVRVDLRQANPHGLHRVVRWLSSCRAWDRLSAIVTPTTVIAGAQDRVVPFDHQRHVAARTRGRLRVHRHSGHLPMVDQTRWFAHTIDQWARN